MYIFKLAHIHIFNKGVELILVKGHHKLNMRQLKEYKKHLKETVKQVVTKHGVHCSF